MALSAFLLAIQSLLLVAMILLLTLARRTSRGRRSKQRGYLLWAIFVGLLAFSGSVWLLLDNPSMTRSLNPLYWSALLLPLATEVVGVLTIRRALEVRFRRTPNVTTRRQFAEGDAGPETRMPDDTQPG